MKFKEFLDEIRNGISLVHGVSGNPRGGFGYMNEMKNEKGLNEHPSISSVSGGLQRVWGLKGVTDILNKPIIRDAATCVDLDFESLADWNPNEVRIVGKNIGGHTVGLFRKRLMAPSYLAEMFYMNPARDVRHRPTEYAFRLLVPSKKLESVVPALVKSPDMMIMAYKELWPGYAPDEGELKLSQREKDIDMEEHK